MDVKSWGARGDIAEHRVVMRWWVNGTGGELCEGVASPRPYLDQLMTAVRVAGNAECVERFYDALVESGRFSLDEIDEICRALLKPAHGATFAPPLLDVD